MENLGDMIRSIRKGQGLTQEKLGELSKLSTMSIRRYESGERAPDFEQLRRIATALKVSTLAFARSVDDFEKYEVIEKEDFKKETNNYFLKWLKGNNIDIVPIIVDETEGSLLCLNKESYFLTKEQTNTFSDNIIELTKTYGKSIGKDITARNSDGTPM